MLKKLSCIALMCSPLTHANLIALENHELTQATGQGGADLSWTLSLNHEYAENLELSNISKFNGGTKPTEVYYRYSENCADNNVLCRLAIAPNNHEDNNGNKKWLVFKQIQGTLQIDKFSLDGTTIINHKNDPQTAMQLKFYDDKPLKIRNLGFATMAIETGSKLEGEGYANSTVYEKYNSKQILADGTIGSEVSLDVPLFDRGAEKGFMGLNIHGNMHMSGNVKIFSYNCTVSAASRC
ncbi:hypothetical protein HX122_05430 [Acinetobacter towneri]|uniref:hypothetical protein n=1 Tax=Acinetobacter towneri TaxID=202956 RepID=UPI002579217C|nr:hypothetical protein [Acinetobacter towneri]MDM1754427.1 hypothetical protein [Acinetobacter towneri]